MDFPRIRILPCVGKVKYVANSVHKFDDVLGTYDKILAGHNG